MHMQKNVCRLIVCICLYVSGCTYTADRDALHDTAYRYTVYQVIPYIFNNQATSLHLLSPICLYQHQDNAAPMNPLDVLRLYRDHENIHIMLRYAILRGDMQTVSYIIADPHLQYLLAQPAPDGRTPLHHLVTAGHTYSLPPFLHSIHNVMHLKDQHGDSLYRIIMTHYKHHPAHGTQLLDEIAQDTIAPPLSEDILAGKPTTSLSHQQTYQLLTSCDRHGVPNWLIILLYGSQETKKALARWCGRRKNSELYIIYLAWLYDNGMLTEAYRGQLLHALKQDKNDEMYTALQGIISGKNPFIAASLMDMTAQYDNHVNQSEDKRWRVLSTRSYVDGITSFLRDMSCFLEHTEAGRNKSKWLLYAISQAFPVQHTHLYRYLLWPQKEILQELRKGYIGSYTRMFSQQLFRTEKRVCNELQQAVWNLISQDNTLINGLSSCITKQAQHCDNGIEFLLILLPDLSHLAEAQQIKDNILQGSIDTFLSRLKAGSDTPAYDCEYYALIMRFISDEKRYHILSEHLNTLYHYVTPRLVNLIQSPGQEKRIRNILAGCCFSSHMPHIGENRAKTHNTYLLCDVSKGTSAIYNAFKEAQHKDIEAYRCLFDDIPIL